MPDLFLELKRDDDADEMITDREMSEDEALAFLASAEITASKLIPWGSNYSFAVALEREDGGERLAIYKPRQGEAPLYDFPDGTLYLRELAAYLLSRHLGWDLVPPTVVRDGPHGVGSVQLYIEPVPTDAESERYWGGCTLEIERLVLFDHVANNADRKIGHCLLDRTGKVWGIDHGLTFNVYPKMRTVLWQFVGSEISPALLAELRHLRADIGALTAALRPCLSRAEIDALVARVDGLLATGSYPTLNPRRNVPYGWW